MKLMTPQQVNDAKASELNRDVLRMKELKEQTDKVLLNLSKAEGDFSAALARHRTQWAEEEGEHAKRVTEMEKEIAKLESRKEKALQPIIVREREADRLLEQAQGILERAKERESDAEELSEVLQDRLDSLGGREQDLLAQELRIRIANEGSEKQQENIRAQSASLSEAIRNFAKEKIEWLKVKKVRENDLTMMEASLNAKKDGLYRQAKSLKDWEIRLKDREGIVDRKIIRLNNISPRK